MPPKKKKPSNTIPTPPELPCCPDCGEEMCLREAAALCCYECTGCTFVTPPRRWAGEAQKVLRLYAAAPGLMRALDELIDEFGADHPDHVHEARQALAAVKGD